MANKANKKEDYLYLSSLLRAREAKMLTREKAERMSRELPTTSWPR